jgi:hypothetical protein
MMPLIKLDNKAMAFDFDNREAWVLNNVKVKENLPELTGDLIVSHQPNLPWPESTHDLHITKPPTERQMKRYRRKIRRIKPRGNKTRSQNRNKQLPKRFNTNF